MLSIASYIAIPAKANNIIKFWRYKMSKFTNLARTNVIVETTDNTEGFTLQAFIRNPEDASNDLLSDVYAHTYSGDLSPVEMTLLQRGVRDYVQGGITGATDTATILTKANKKIAELVAGTIVERTVGNGAVPAISNLLLAVMEFFPEVTPAVWASMSKEERAEKASDRRVVIKQSKLNVAAEQARINALETAHGEYIA